jgi:hypothetical protein
LRGKFLYKREKKTQNKGPKNERRKTEPVGDLWDRKPEKRTEVKPRVKKPRKQRGTNRPRTGVKDENREGQN